MKYVHIVEHSTGYSPFGGWRTLAVFDTLEEAEAFIHLVEIHDGHQHCENIISTVPYNPTHIPEGEGLFE